MDDSVNQAITEVVDAVEAYSRRAPLQWLHRGEDLCEIFPDESSRFHRFSAWIDEWMGRIFPQSIRAQEELDELASSDAPGELAFASMDFGFLCGYLMGAKSHGATRAEMLLAAKNFVEQKESVRRDVDRVLGGGL